MLLNVQRHGHVVLQEMQAAGIKPDQIAYGTAVSACAMAGQWQKAVALLADMRRSKLRPDVVAYRYSAKCKRTTGVQNPTDGMATSKDTAQFRCKAHSQV